MIEREKLDTWCEKGILVLVLLALVSTPVALGGVLPWQFSLLEGLTVGAGFLWLVRLWAAKRPKFLWPPICWAVLAFALYAAARYAFADVEYRARGELSQILVYTVLFFIIVNNLHRQETTQTIAFVMLFLGMCLAGYAMLKYFSKSPEVWGRSAAYPGRAGGTFYNPNHLGAFLGLLLPLGLAYVLTGRVRHEIKILIGYACAVMLGGVAVTLSRGAILSTAIVLGVLCVGLLFHRNYRLQAVLLLLVLGGLGAVLAPRLEHARQRFDEITDASRRSNDSRWYIWRSAYHMWEDHPVWGLGPAQFDTQFPRYRSYGDQLRPEFTHCEYLNTLVDYGAVGGVLVAGVLGCLFHGLLRTRKAVSVEPDDFARKKSNKFAFYLGATLGLLALLIHAVVEFPLHIPGVAVLAVAFTALLSSQWRFATERFWFSAGRTVQVLASVVVVGLSGYLLRNAWVGWREDGYLRQARACADFSYARIEKLKLAAGVEPRNAATAQKIAECYRVKSFGGGDHYVEFAREAMTWYQRGMKLNPHEPYNWLGYGMCLDWTNSDADGVTENSWSYYQKTIDLDPNGFYTAANVGWHFVQAQDYPAARVWFERSLWLEKVNPVSATYLPIVEQRLQESAAEQTRFP